jgi:hypothetical protein
VPAGELELEIPAAVSLERVGGVVSSAPIGLHDQAPSRPVEVHFVPGDYSVDDRTWKAGLGDQLEKAALQLAAHGWRLFPEGFQEASKGADAAPPICSGKCSLQSGSVEAPQDLGLLQDAFERARG